MLSIASFFFTNDANVLVLSPLERMLEKVKLIAKNPLAASAVGKAQLAFQINYCIGLVTKLIFYVVNES